MSRTLNILSIDFDYFQNPTPENLIHDYPDGIDLSTELSNVIWAVRYADPDCQKRLLQIQPWEKPIRTLAEHILKHTNRGTQSAICQSHVNAYDFTLNLLSCHPDCTHINVYNIDMHHDSSNLNMGIDCGNWLGHLHSDLKCRKNNPVKIKIHWICNPVSYKMYDIEDLNIPNRITSDIKKLPDKHWHGVFLCRSDQWVPPHLDQEFLWLSHIIKDRTTTVHIDPEVTKSRYDDDFRTACDQMRQCLYNARNCVYNSQKENLEKQTKI